MEHTGWLLRETAILSWMDSSPNSIGTAFPTTPRDTLTVRDYELTLSAQVKAVERATGRVLLDEKVVGRTTVRSGPDLTSSERQAAPLLAEDMARTLVNLLADGTW